MAKYFINANQISSLFITDKLLLIYACQPIQE